MVLPGPFDIRFESKGLLQSSHEKHFLWKTPLLETIFSASNTFPPHLGQPSLSPAFAFIDVVLIMESAMILFPSTLSRLGIELDLDLIPDLECGREAALDEALVIVLDLDLLECVPYSSW